MPTVKRFQDLRLSTKALIFTLVLGANTACIDKDDEPRKPKASATAASVDQTESHVTNILLKDGFYQSKALDIKKKPQHSESHLIVHEHSNEHLTEESASLIEGLGFSGIQKESKALVESTPPVPFCLEASSADHKPIIKDACQKISNRLASVTFSACEAAQLKPTGCSSANGFPILMREFAPVQKRKPQGRILIVGGTHGDELTTVSVTLQWIKTLNRHHSGLFHWHIAPMMNPDGVLKKSATRTNNNGVDLNRNMPSDDWHQNAIKYWADKSGKDPRKNPGKTPASEPETRWLIDEINHFKPDAIISVHAPYGVVDFDALSLNTAPKSLGKLRLNLLGTYPGSLGNYAGINRNIPVITLELPHSWVMPSDKESAKIWADIVDWLKKNVSH